MTTYYEEKFDGKFWQDQRQRVIDRDGSCVVCKDEDANTVHHIIEQRSFDSEENAHDMDNLLLCCHQCHWVLEDMEVEEQRKLLPS